MTTPDASDRLMSRMLRNASTADLYDLLAQALTEIHAREVASEDPDALDLETVRVDAQWADIYWDESDGRFEAVFYDEGSASLACEETRAPKPGSTWPHESDNA